MDPDRPEPAPMSRIKEGLRRERSESARWVMLAWMFFMREFVVYFFDVGSS
jgi:hypothetical protein